ncbi:MAG: hypothetical protein MHM6MM_009268, partial [Cercozoa sp. M6MM]
MLPPGAADPEEEEIPDLPPLELITNKAKWRYRERGYEIMAQQIRQGGAAAAVPYREALLSAPKSERIFKPLRAALMALSDWFRADDDYLFRQGDESAKRVLRLFSDLVGKCLGGRAARDALEAAEVFAEAGSRQAAANSKALDAWTQALCKGFGDRKSKVSAPTSELVLRVLRNYGLRCVSVAALAPSLAAACNSGCNKTRDAGKQLIVAMFDFVGPIFRDHFDKLKLRTAQVKELQETLDKYDNMPLQEFVPMKPLKHDEMCDDDDDDDGGGGDSATGGGDATNHLAALGLAEIDPLSEYKPPEWKELCSSDWKVSKPHLVELLSVLEAAIQRG